MELPAMLALLMLLLLASALLVGLTEAKHAWADASGIDQRSRFDDKVARARDYANALKDRAKRGELDRAQVEPMVRQYIADQPEFEEFEHALILREAMAERWEG
jgi:hypothetical protein